MSKSLGLREDSPGGDRPSPPPGWKVLVVDDDPEVHDVTRLALDGFTFAGRGLRFINAHSGAEARDVLRREGDIAMILLDVVMETDDSGLDVVDYVRNELGNRFVRIVLRTGQPGQAPELDVISRYDINDYKHKTELTRERLFTTIYTSLSTYRDLMTLEASRRGLEKVIEASARIFELRFMDQFAQGVLDQLVALLLFAADAVLLQVDGVAAAAAGERLRIVAGTGAFSSLVGQDANGALPDPVVDRIVAALGEPGASVAHDHFIGVQRGRSGQALVFYVTGGPHMPAPDRHLLDVFCRNVAIARENVQFIATAMGLRSE